MYDCIKLYNLFEHFKSDNIKKKDVEYIIINYKNIIIDKIDENGRIKDFKLKI